MILLQSRLITWIEHLTRRVPHSGIFHSDFMRRTRFAGLGSYTNNLLVCRGNFLDKPERIAYCE